jgi:hypothetical protein
MVQKILSDNVVKLKNTEKINGLRNLISKIITDNKLQSSVEGKTSTGENIQQYELFPFVNQIAEHFKFIEDTLRYKNLLLPNEILNPVSCWTVIGGENSFHKIHRHNKKSTNHIASVTYLSNANNTLEKPGSFYAILDDSVITIEPKEGDILLFPVHIYHGTYPQGVGIRQTLSIDFEIKDKNT